MGTLAPVNLPYRCGPEIAPLPPQRKSTGDDVKILTEQKSKALAEKNGWSLEFAEGYLKGEYTRRSSAKLSSYAMVGLDDFCMGFRAGYFGRHVPAATHAAQASAAAGRPVHGARATPATASPTTTAFKEGFAY